MFQTSNFVSCVFITMFSLGVNALYAQPSSNSRDRQPPSVEEIFKKMDSDEDGKLSEKEVRGPLKKDFPTIDANEDGFITAEELEKAPKPKRQRPSR